MISLWHSALVAKLHKLM